MITSPKVMSRITCLFCAALSTSAFTCHVIAAPAETTAPLHGSSVRERLLFNADWKFVKNDPSDAPKDSLGYDHLKPYLLASSAKFLATPVQPVPAGKAPGEDVSYAQPDLDDTKWRTLDLPHDWGIEGPFDIGLPGETAKLPWHGVAWYRKSFDLPATDSGRRIVIEIDGAMSRAAVWCNGHLVGGWPYGYASWQLDLTPFVKLGSKNTLSIRLDNPKESSRWYPGGGIYRNVWLSKTSPVHVAQWGTHITTREVTPANAKVAVRADIANSSDSSAKVKVAFQLYKADSNGHPTGSVLVSSKLAELELAAGETKPAAAEIVLAKPILWDLKTPERYVAVTLVQQNDRLADRHESPFGVRTAEFTADDGFHLNGHRVQIQGACQHHDLGALGAAFNVRAAERQLQLLRGMGVNAIRTSHNPPAPEFLELCDRMGFLVMDEFVDCWKLRKKPNGYNLLFDDWSEADLRALVRRDRNHPCVILWSIGNEIVEQGRAEGPAMAAKLSGFVKIEDTTRPTTIGVSDVKGGYNGFQTGVDVFGYNYKPFEYGKFHAAHRNQPIFGSETSSTVSSRGEYAFPVSEDKKGGLIGQQVSSYDYHVPPWATTPDTEFKGLDANPFVAGEFIWTGIDYLGEPTPFNSDLTNLLNYHSAEEKARAEEELKALGKIRVKSRSSYFAPIDIAGFPKDRYFLYQSRWRPEMPMAHLLPHWNWPDRVGQVTPVFVYTSGDEAELFLNGKSLGRKKKEAGQYRLRWDDVVYQPGELKVVAYRKGQPWAKDMVKTTGEVAAITLEADRKKLTADGKDLSYVTLRLTDAAGLVDPVASNVVHFEVTGPAELIATDNGDATDLNIFSSPDRAAFHGLALAIVRTKAGETGEIRVKATSPALRGGEVILRAEN